MKHLMILLIALTLFSCSTETEKQSDCNCDRVMSVQTFNILGTYKAEYITINECTQVQKSKSYSTTNYNTLPKVGDCR